VIIIAVGSRNPNKVRAVEIAFRLVGFTVNVLSVEPPSDIPPEPMGLDEIAKGAIRRARHALSNVSNADFGVGIEAGIVKILDNYLDITLAAIMDRDDTVTMGLSPAFMIPPRFTNELLNGKELNEVAENYYGIPSIGKRFGLVGMITKGFVNRIDLNVEAVYMALMPRVPWNQDLYGLRK
jgi:inosine/xanthosine triphosphatase